MPLPVIAGSGLGAPTRHVNEESIVNEAGGLRWLSFIVFGANILFPVGCTYVTPEAEMSTSQLHCNIGVVEKGSTHAVLFTVTNTHQEPVVLLAQQVSCGCLKIESKPIHIATGGEASVEGSISVGQEQSGKFTVAAVFELSNSEGKRLEQLKGTVTGMVGSNMISVERSFDVHGISSEAPVFCSIPVTTSSTCKHCELTVTESPDWISDMAILKKQQTPCSCSDFRNITNWTIEFRCIPASLRKSPASAAVLRVKLREDCTGGTQPTASVMVRPVAERRFTVAPSVVVMRRTQDEYSGEAVAVLSNAQRNELERYTIALEGMSVGIPVRLDVVRGEREGERLIRMKLDPQALDGAGVSHLSLAAVCDGRTLENASIEVSLTDEKKRP